MYDVQQKRSLFSRTANGRNGVIVTIVNCYLARKRPNEDEKQKRVTCHCHLSHYLLSLDDYFKCIEIAELGDLTSSNIICHLKSQFARGSIPNELISENGLGTKVQHSKISSGVMVFLPTTSCHQYPQTNGEAERAVQTTETLPKKGKDVYMALLNYRSTPLGEIGLSPAQILMGR